MATDSKDVLGLKLEKVGPSVAQLFKFKAMPAKNRPKNILFSVRDEIRLKSFS